LLLGMVMLSVTVGVLSFIGIQGVYSFKDLAKSIRIRASELPLAQELTQRVGDLRISLSRVHRTHEINTDVVPSNFDSRIMREEFSTNLLAVNEALRRYRKQLENNHPSDPRIAGNRQEQLTVREIEVSLAQIEETNQSHQWMHEGESLAKMEEDLEDLQHLSSRLPSYLQQRMHNFAGEVRLQYRTWIAIFCTAIVAAVAMLILLAVWYFRWIYNPLRDLIRESQRIAGGEFGHRIELDTQDEMSDLATAMNEMTQRFQEIQDDLNHQVMQRTMEVVQNEKMASVGFLAAGVAHEINNPLASVAWCAESLEDRLHDVVREGDQGAELNSDEVAILKKYLRKIQEEAFRCKEITERLLDFSRLGDVEKQDTSLKDLIDGVIDMVRHLGKYREKKLEFTCDEVVVASVNPQEIKQVILNLVTNALDSLEPGGVVTLELRKVDGQVEILVTDNGCGMSEEVLKHLFEPFFTRRRDGQGTGLGLSITYRIVADHGGNIAAESAGPGHGSRFRITLPLVSHEKKQTERFAAA